MTNDSSLRQRARKRNAVGEILQRVRISQVYHALTGVKPRRTGAHTCRGPAVWRRGDGDNVSMDDDRGIWHDFRDDTGGGILALIVQVRGGSRSDALRWLADFAGVPLNDRPLSVEELAQCARERADMERTLPTAQYWRRAAVKLSEELLSTLKAALLDGSMEPISVGEIASVHHFLQSFQRLDGAALILEYQWWAKHHPGLTAALLRVAQTWERAEWRALLRYLETWRTPGGNAA